MSALSTEIIEALNVADSGDRTPDDPLVILAQEVRRLSAPTLPPSSPQAALPSEPSKEVFCRMAPNRCDFPNCVCDMKEFPPMDAYRGGPAQAALGVREGEPLALYRKIEANARSLRETAMESMSASPPEGYDELEGRAVEIADECCRDGLMAMQTAILNFLYDQMTEGQKESLAAPVPAGGELGDFQKLLLTVAHFDLAYHTLRSKARAVTQSGRSFSGAQSAVLTDALDSLQIALQVEPPKWDRESLDRAAPVAQGGETEAGHRAIAYAKAAQIDKEFARLSVLVDSLACHLNPNKEP